MILHSLPDPDATRERLLVVTSIVWAALEAGLLKAREYFEVEGTDIDPWLAANITRYHAKIFLDGHQHDGDYERVELLNSGLRIVAVREGTRFDVWIRKSDDGEMPVPHSDNMQAFCHQPVMNGFYPEAMDGEVQTVSLLGLWESPSSYTHISAFSLCLPAQGGERRADLQQHWTIAVPHPMATTIVEDITSGPDVEEPAGDLPIEPELGEQTGSTDGDNEE